MLSNHEFFIQGIFNRALPSNLNVFIFFANAEEGTAVHSQFFFSVDVEEVNAVQFKNVFSLDLKEGIAVQS